MNNNLLKLTIIFAFAATIVVSFSCKRNQEISKNETKKIIFEDKNENESYQVWEHIEKLDSNSIEQCEKFYQFESNELGFEIYSADLIDLISIFKSINKNEIKFDNNNGIFYTIKYQGKNNDSIANLIINKIIESNQLKIDTTIVKKEMLEILDINKEKLNHYKNLENKDSSLILTNNILDMQNFNLFQLVSSLNDSYPNRFSTGSTIKINTDDKFDFEIPLGNEESVVQLLSNKYGISFKLTDVDYKYYTIRK